MKHNSIKILVLLLLLCLLFTSLISCEFGNTEVLPDDKGGEEEKIEAVDFAGSLSFDPNNTDTFKLEVTVKTFVDGDTTHFNVPKTVLDNGVLKARYLAINTPESTGKIEEWGKTASNFTKEKLSSATKIYVESEDTKLNADSTGSRYLLWIWYLPAGSQEYRNLNIEILQNGLAIASNSANNRYGSTAVAAIAQAKKQKLHIYSGEKDPNFYYGEIQEVTIKELRTNVAVYTGKDVSFEAIVVRNQDNTLYVEEFDAEDGIYYGFAVYYGFSADPDLLSFMKIGNRLKLVGNVQYYEAGGTYQLSGLKYNIRKPDESCALIAEGQEIDYPETDPDLFLTGEKSIEVNQTLDGETTQVEKQFSYASLVMNTSLSMKNLEVQSIYTTNNGGDNDGAMTLTCRTEGGATLTVRTAVLRDAEGNLVTASAFEDKTIDVKGFVDYYDQAYQIKVFSVNDITVKD